MSGVTLLALAGCAGLLSAWATVILLTSSVRLTFGSRSWRIRGPVAAGASRLSALVANHLLPAVPAPARLFEQLGPDRFRREFMRNLRTRSDSHVDEIMGRRTDVAWQGLSSYARNRVYAHVHRRLPFAVDDFVDHLHRDLDEILVPSALVRHWVAENPGVPGDLFLAAFGAGLRPAWLLSATAGGLAGLLVSLAGGGPALWILVPAVSMGVSSSCLLLLLTWPEQALRFWPFGLHGILRRYRQRYLQLLARGLAEGPLSWESVSRELMTGPHSGRLRIIVRREMGSILDTTWFKVTLQFLLGPEAMVAVKQSAIEKAFELLESVPASPGLREGYRLEIERTLFHAAGQMDEREYRDYWRHIVRLAWKWIPAPLLLLGAAAGYGLQKFVMLGPWW